MLPKAIPAALPPKKKPPFDDPVLEPIRAACERFVSTRRAFSTYKMRAVAAVVRCGHHLVMRFKNGRWTISGRNVDSVYPYPRDWHEAKRKHRAYWSSYGQMESVEITYYLKSLVVLGLLTEEQVEAFQMWRQKEIDVQYRVENIMRLAKEAEELGVTVVDSTGAIVPVKRRS